MSGTHWLYALILKHSGRRFEDFFSKYAKGKDGLTWEDVWDGLNGQRLNMDPLGAFATFFKCESPIPVHGWSMRTNLASFIGLVTYLLLWPEDGIMKKDDVRRVYDGSIFFDIAAKRADARSIPTAEGKVKLS